MWKLSPRERRKSFVAPIIVPREAARQSPSQYVPLVIRPGGAEHWIERMRPALDARTDHFRGMHGIGDPIAAKTKRELQARIFARHASYVWQSVVGAGETARPGEGDGRQLPAKQVRVAGGQLADLARQ